MITVVYDVSVQTYLRRVIIRLLLLIPEDVVHSAMEFMVATEGKAWRMRPNRHPARKAEHSGCSLQCMVSASWLSKD